MMASARRSLCATHIPLAWKVMFSLRKISLLLGLLLISCVSAPVQQMSDARQAIQAAEIAGSTDDPDLARARIELEVAEIALEQRAFERARAHAERARRLAVEARRRAQTPR